MTQSVVLDRYHQVERALAKVPPVRMLRAVPETGGYAVRTVWRHFNREPLEGLPRARLTPALLAHVAMDEALLMLAHGPERYPRRADYERVGAELGEALTQFEEQGWLADPRSYHLDPPPLEHVQEGSGWADGLSYRKLTWESRYEPHADEPGGERWAGYATNRLAGAWMLRHDDDRPRPWIVCIHGFGMGYPFMDLTAFHAAHLHRDLGVNLVGPTLPLHGHRKVNRVSGDEFLGWDIMNTVHGLTQAAFDIRRLIGWIRVTQEPTGVGVLGISLGGYTTSLVAGLEPGLDAAIAGIPVVDFPGVLRAQIPSTILNRTVEHNIFGGPAETVNRVVSPLAFAPQLAHSRRFIFAGVGDRLAHPRQAHSLWEHWERPSIRWYPGSHIGYVWSSKVRRYIDLSPEVSGLTARP